MRKSMTRKKPQAPETQKDMVALCCDGEEQAQQYKHGQKYEIIKLQRIKMHADLGVIGLKHS